MMLAMSAGVRAGKRLEIVVLHSYHPSYPWTARQDEGFTRALSAAFPDDNVNFSMEYLDTKRVRPTAAYLETFLAYLQARYAGNRPDLVYVTDDNAMNFMLGAGGRVFPGTPLV